MTNKHVGSHFDDFLREEGVLEEATAVSIKRVIGWQIQKRDERAAHLENSDGSEDSN
jgi:antitoxin HicB